MGQEVKRESENQGLLNPATDGRNLKTVGGKSDGLLAGMPSDKNFDLQGKSYKGPENWQPKDMGVTDNQP